MIAGNHSNDTLVERGYQGIWREPLYPGKHRINTRVRDVVIVPTHNIALDWSNDPNKSPENYDASLHALQLQSRDGFDFNVEVTQVIRINGQDAPKMISKVGVSVVKQSDQVIIAKSGVIKYGSIKSLVTRVLESLVVTHFNNSAQDRDALDFQNRSDRLGEAIDHIKEALKDHGVEAVDTHIKAIKLPEELVPIIRERTKTKEQRKTDEEKRKTEKGRRELVIEQEKTDAERDKVRQQNNVELEELKRRARSEETAADAEAIREKGKAEADADRASADVIGVERTYQKTSYTRRD